jgi:hypothetical protein
MVPRRQCLQLAHRAFCTVIAPFESTVPDQADEWTNPLWIVNGTGMPLTKGQPGPTCHPARPAKSRGLAPDTRETLS